MKSYIKRSIWLFILGFVPQLAFAGSNQIWPVVNTFTPASADWSIDFLRMMFGQVGNVLTGAQQTIIGKLFSVFNVAVMGLVAIVIIYVIIRIIMDTCILGPEMRQKISHWVAVRVAIGTSLLVPFKGGYSVIQVIIMWAVMQGIGLADHAWTTAVDYLKQGGNIFVSNQQAADSNKIRAPLVDTAQANDTPKDADPSKVGTVDILRSLVAMHIIERDIQEQQEALKQDMLDHPYNYPKEGTPEYKELMNKYSRRVSLKINYDDTTQTATIPYSDDPDYSKFNGSCGVYNWGVNNHPISNDPAKAKQLKEEYESAKEAGLKQMVLDLDPLAKNLVNQAYEYNENKREPVIGGAVQILNTAGTYQSILYPSVLFASALEDEKNNDLNKILTSYGWAAAGRYYWQISQNPGFKGFDTDYNKNNYQVSINKYPPGIKTKNVDDTDRGQSYDNLYKQLKSEDAKEAFSTASQFINGSISNQGAELPSGIHSQSIKILTNYNNNVEKKYSGSTKLPNLNSSTFFKNKSDFHLQNHFDMSDDGGYVPPNQGSGHHSHTPPVPKKGKAYVWIRDRVTGLLNDLTPKGDKSFKIFSRHANNAIDTWFSYMVDSKNEFLSPMTKLQEVGTNLMTQAAETWKDLFKAIYQIGLVITSSFGILGVGTSFGAAVTTTPFGFGAGVAALGTTIAALGNSVLSFVMAIMFFTLPLVIAVTAPMFVAGAILSVYLPLVPFMFFTFGIISWLIFVIEAMAAAPLVALGVTHPEGHDLMGKAEQALMLWLSVFLRPIAMIIGLIAGIVLLYIAVSVLNAGFGGIVDDIFNGAPSSAFKGITIILIYTFIMVALVNQCFGLIYLMPEKIMRWLGLHPEGSDIPHLTESVKSGVTPFMQGTADGAGKVSGESSRKIAEGIGAVAQSSAQSCEAYAKYKQEKGSGGGSGGTSITGDQGGGSGGEGGASDAAAGAAGAV
ncbi:MAG: hypothetical protein AMJ43_05695 [Coxiella sp. DG_40]|nr:MAG: hypothetical protein AMJ43_05695 [Coxiella sp. DG_40]